MPKAEFLSMVDGAAISAHPARKPQEVSSPEQPGDSASEVDSSGTPNPNGAGVAATRDNYMNSSESLYAWARNMYGEVLGNDSGPQNDHTNAKLPNSEAWQTPTSDPDEYAE